MNIYYAVFGGIEEETYCIKADNFDEAYKKAKEYIKNNKMAAFDNTELISLVLQCTIDI